MFERETILPLTLGLVLAIAVNLLGIVGTSNAFDHSSGDAFTPTKQAPSEPEPPADDQDVPPPPPPPLPEEPEYRVGSEQPSPLDINYISHEDFQDLQARRQQTFDQPTVQMTVDPDPLAQQTPVDPTDPALVQQPTPPTAAAQPVTPAQPTELAANTPPPSQPQGTGQQPEQQTAPITPIESETVELTNAPTEVRTDEDENPLLAADLPDAPRDATITRTSPDVDEGEPTEAQEGREEPSDTTEPSESTEDSEPTPDEPTETTEPGEREAAAVEVAMADIPLPPRTESNADPTAAPRDRSESEPVSRIAVARLVPGAVWARQGIRINTVRPRWPVVTRMTASPRNPIVRIEFNGDGEVTSMQFVRASGWKNVDSPLRIAIYKWTAEGNFPEEGFTIDNAVILLGANPEPEEDDAQGDQPVEGESESETESSE